VLTWRSGINLHDAYATPWVVPNEVANRCTDDGAVKQYCRDGVDLVPIPPTVQGSSDAISNLTSMEMWLRGFSSVRIPVVNVADTVCAGVDVSIVILLWPCRPCLAFDYVGLHAYGYGQWILYQLE